METASSSVVAARVGGRQQGYRRLLMTATVMLGLALLLTAILRAVLPGMLALNDGPRFLYHSGLIIVGLTLLGVVLHTWRTRAHHLAVRVTLLLLSGLLIAETLVVFVWPPLVHRSAIGVGVVALLTLISLTRTAWNVEALARPRPVEGPVPLWKDYLSLTKPRVISLLLLTTWAAMFLPGVGIPSFALVCWTLLGGYLAAGGAHAINCYLDKDVDQHMGRTSRRPLPSGRIPARNALIFGIGLGVLSFVVLSLFVNLLSAVLALAGLLFYVLIYTSWLKRSTWLNIVIGGAAGAFPPLVGWAAMTNRIDLAAIILFAIIFYWTPPHFWALALIRKEDYARAGIPMLPVVSGDDHTRWQIVLYSLQMFALTLLPAAIGAMGLLYLGAAVLLGGLFLRDAWRLLREKTQPAAWRLYKYSLLYLALLFAAMALDRLLVM